MRFDSYPLLVIVIPIFATLVLFLFGGCLGVLGAALIAMLHLFLATLGSWILLFDVLLFGPVYVDGPTWFSCDSLVVRWSIRYDLLAASLATTVCTVAICATCFSLYYVRTDPHFTRFLWLFMGFIASMLVLVTSGNLVQLLAAWEWVGLFSYWLIGFWSTRPTAVRSGAKAVCYNRFGDACLFAVVLCLVGVTGACDLDVVFSLFTAMGRFCISFFGFLVPLQEVVGILLVVAAAAKSAQFGFHTWLPDAMEGPTPVSALLHAATLVVAGIFLLCRLAPVLVGCSFAYGIMACFGIFTIIFGSVLACLQNDLKRIIAYSTMGQLGYMFLACSLTLYNLAIFHTAAHAFIKAGLFLAAGAVIHGSGGEQDIRRLAAVPARQPVLYGTLVLNFAALAGLPLLSGSLSKEAIIVASGSNLSEIGIFSYICGVVGFTLTVTYSLRALLYLSAGCGLNLPRPLTQGIAVFPLYVYLPIAVLTALGLFFGICVQEFSLSGSSAIFGSFGGVSNRLHAESFYSINHAAGLPVSVYVGGLLVLCFGWLFNHMCGFGGLFSLVDFVECTPLSNSLRRTGLPNHGAGRILSDQVDGSYLPAVTAYPDLRSYLKEERAAFRIIRGLSSVDCCVCFWAFLVGQFTSGLGVRFGFLLNYIDQFVVARVDCLNFLYTRKSGFLVGVHFASNWVSRVVLGGFGVNFVAERAFSLVIFVGSLWELYFERGCVSVLYRLWAKPAAEQSIYGGIQRSISLGTFVYRIFGFCLVGCVLVGCCGIY